MELDFTYQQFKLSKMFKYIVNYVFHYYSLLLHIANKSPPDLTVYRLGFVNLYVSTLQQPGA